MKEWLTETYNAKGKDPSRKGRQYLLPVDAQNPSTKREQAQFFNRYVRLPPLKTDEIKGGGKRLNDIAFDALEDAKSLRSQCDETTKLKLPTISKKGETVKKVTEKQWQDMQSDVFDKEEAMPKKRALCKKENEANITSHQNNRKKAEGTKK